jgi:hypothetical protein
MDVLRDYNFHVNPSVSTAQLWFVDRERRYTVNSARWVTLRNVMSRLAYRSIEPFSGRDIDISSGGPANT